MKAGLYASAIALFCASSALAQNNQAGAPEQISTTFINADGEQVGTATLTETPNGVLIRAGLTGLPPGMHAFHIHETGKCDAQDGFKSAGGHYAPRGAKHGYNHPDGPHAGDLPNQHVSADGTLKADIISHQTTLRDGETTLFDDDGSALVIHSGADDYESQPSGDAGDRIACAPITNEQRRASQQ
ncbi:MAG: superoxide dismutase family protein [Rhodomicrobiaceae bacterium]